MSGLLMLKLGRFMVTRYTHTHTHRVVYIYENAECAVLAAIGFLLDRNCP
jgi:hypothetical protein